MVLFYSLHWAGRTGYNSFKFFNSVVDKWKQKNNNNKRKIDVGAFSTVSNFVVPVRTWFLLCSSEIVCNKIVTT
jgi:hypothetical protein